MSEHLEEGPENPRLEKVSKLQGHFFVPSYQRGYRWGRHEVEALLNDIYGCRLLDPGTKYCLQPIVVKEKISAAPGGQPREGLPAPGQVYYELIDGQQRLTTLFLLYLYLQRVKNVVPRFNLAYETRPGSATYLRDPDQAQRDANIDFFHMYEAYRCIEQWFEETARQTDDGQVAGVADDMYRHLREQVHVIWYDAGEQDSITLFTRLNVGRIALTNAELVKALLLSGRDTGAAAHYRQIEIATQWDMIERSLQDDAFWAFLTNEPASAYPARIELIFDLLARKSTARSDRFFTFEYFKKRLDQHQPRDKVGKKGIPNAGLAPQIAVWTPVLELYHLLREWFENRDLYHKIGYLVAAGDRLGELVVTPIDGYGGSGITVGPECSPRELDERRDELRRGGARFVAQEGQSLSTLPTFDGHELQRRHVDMRAFVMLSRDAAGQIVAEAPPVAMTRVAPAGTMVVNASSGGGGKDTWIHRA